MPLQLPNLDDRRYNDLVAEALARIPTYSPEWTNHNPSDPGITLIELFAYLADLLLYRLNRVTDNNIRKFLKLLNDPTWNTGELQDEIRKTVLGIRERYRAVTKDDYEFLSTESFNQWLIENSKSSINLVARAHCVPQRNLDFGTEVDRLQLRPEHVSVIIIPAPEKPNPNPPPLTAASPVDTSMPQPSAEQINALLAFLDERRMLTTKLHVTGPVYAHFSIQMVIARFSDAVDADVAAAVNSSLTSLFSPLPSETSDGWPFGHDIFVSEIYQTLEKISGIDYITDVMLNPGNDNLASPIWHPEGDLVGLEIQEHHLPVFDNASIVIASDLVFVVLNLSVTAKAQTGADLALLKRLIKGALRSVFSPAMGGPGPTTTQPTDIFVSDLQIAIRHIPGILDPVSVAVDGTPSSIVQTDKDRGQFIHVLPGHVVNWHVDIQLS